MSDAENMRSIGLLLRGINLDFRQTVDAALRDAGAGATFGEVSPMMSLKLEPGLNGAQLARLSMVSAQAMNAVLKELSRKSYVERRPHPQSLRADSWHLTKDGTSKTPCNDAPTISGNKLVQAPALMAAKSRR